MAQYLALALFGWVTGIFVNYLADVLPYKRRLVMPFCAHCESRIGFWNYFVWPRHCTHCNKRRAWRTWLAEVGFIGASIWLWNAQTEIGYSLGLVLLAYLGLVTIIDLEHRLILHPVSLVGAILGLGIGLWLHGLIATLLGGLVGFLGMLALYYLGILFVRLSARLRGQTLEESEGIGFGDVNLSGVVGLLLGWPGILAGLLTAILLGGVVSLFYLLMMIIFRRYHPALALPYGPFLAASAVILLYFKAAILG